MEKKYQHYRTEGTAALKLEVYSTPAQTPIIPFDVRSSQKSPHNKVLVSRSLKNTLSNDPLLGSIRKAGTSSRAFYANSKEDQRLFFKGSVLATLFALVVILIGA